MSSLIPYQSNPADALLEATPALLFGDPVTFVVFDSITVSGKFVLKPLWDNLLALSQLTTGGGGAWQVCTHVNSSLTPGPVSIIGWDTTFLRWKIAPASSAPGSAAIAHGFLLAATAPEVAYAVNTAYTLGQATRPPTPNGYLYICTQAGNTGLVQPVWTAQVGAFVADGTIIWQCQKDYHIYLQGSFATAIDLTTAIVGQAVYLGTAGAITLNPAGAAFSQALGFVASINVDPTTGGTIQGLLQSPVAFTPSPSGVQMFAQDADPGLPQALGSFWVTTAGVWKVAAAGQVAWTVINTPYPGP